MVPIGPQKSMCQPQMNPKCEGQVHLDEVVSEGEFETKVELRKSTIVKKVPQTEVSSPTDSTTRKTSSLVKDKRPVAEIFKER